jgi:predicted chitinase
MAESAESAELARVMKELVEHFRYMGDSTHQASTGVKTFSDATTEAAKAEKEAADIIDKANRRMEQAQNQAIAGMASFGKALTNGADGGFNKFGDSLNSAAGAVATVAKNFGPLGAVLGGIVQVSTKLLTMQMKQADDALKASDEIKKLGNAGALSTQQVVDMVHASGLSLEQSKKFTDAMKRTSGGLIALGDKFGDGALNFGKMVAVTDATREAFQRMGVSQEELMNQQADYVALQTMSGKSLADQAKNGDALKKASLEYSQNLLRLSALTGKNADQLQEDQKAAMLEYEEVIATRLEDDKIRKLKKEGRNDEAAALQQEQDARKEYITQVTATLGKGAGLQVGKVARTGTFDASTAGLANLGISADQVQKGFKGKTKEQAREGAAEFTESFKGKQSEKINQLGTALQYGGAELGKQVGLEQESVTRTGMTAGTSDVDRNKSATDSVKGVVEGDKTAGGKSAEDNAEKARNAVTTATIKTTVAFDEALAATNPLLQGFGFNLATATAAIGIFAATALSVLTVKAVAGSAGGLKEGIKGVFGKGASSLPDVAKTAGSSVASTAASTVPTGKNGKALAGAALQSHMKKQAGTAAMSSMAGAAAPGGAGGSKVMSMIGDAGPALAKLGTGVGEGAAGFLKAFANPMVLLGATTLGASIAAMIATIGAGIAGASWILGKTLPTLMEGIQSFEKLDGAKLKDAGDGMIGLGQGLAVFGAGGAAAGIGGIIGNMSEGLTAFFGGKTPIDKLVEFSKLDIDGPKVKSNAEAFSAFSAAFAMGGVGQASAAIGNTIGNIGDGIGKLFGQKDIIQKFVDFSKLDIDPKKTKEMAEAFASFSSGLKGGTAPASRGGGGAPASSSGGGAGGGAPAAASAAAPSGGGGGGGAPAAPSGGGGGGGAPAAAAKSAAPAAPSGGGGGGGAPAAAAKSAAPAASAGGGGGAPAAAAKSAAPAASAGGGGGRGGGGGGGGGGGAPAAAAASSAPISGGGGGGGAPPSTAGKIPTAEKSKSGKVDMTGNAAKLANELDKYGITNPVAKKAIVQTAAKESGLDPSAKESGAAAYLKTLAGKGLDYIWKVFPQLKPGGRVAKEKGFGDTGVPADALNAAWSKGDEEFFDYVYGGLGTNKNPGDAYKYRGRGFIGITGRSVYEKVGKEVGKDFVKDPDQVAEDFSGASAALAGYLFSTRGGKSTALKDLNSMTDSNAALKYVLNTVAGLGHKASDFDKEGSHLQEQFRKASQFDDLGSKAISAEKGGIVDGPNSGYPATLHGNEIISPLSPNSILEQLGKTPAASMESASASSSSSTSDTIKEIYSMNTDVMEMLAEKLDTMISKLSDSNDTQSKLLMYSKV